MISSRTITVICLGAALCAAQTINIRGTVKDDADVGISGATVKLEKAGVSTITGADGSFTLGGATATQSVAANRTLAASPVQLQNGKITINLSESAPVAIGIHDVGGRQIYKSKRTYGSGRHAIQLPLQSVGIFLYRLTIGNEAYSFKSSPLGDFTAERTAVSSGTSTLPKQEKASAEIADVISVVKEGQLNYRDSIRTSDASGIVVRMIPNAGNVTDADGNVYQSVRIGNQVWTVENLRVTKYNDGTPIPLVTDSIGWAYWSTPAYFYYNNVLVNRFDSTGFPEQQKWGALYNWYAVHTGKLAPAGWHVSTTNDWVVLENYLIMNGYNWDGTPSGDKIGKSMAAKTDWISSPITGRIGKDPSKNNASGFSALPAGYRRSDGSFLSQGLSGYWWSSTESGDASRAPYCTLYYGAENLGWFNFYTVVQTGNSVRLVRD